MLPVYQVPPLDKWMTTMMVVISGRTKIILLLPGHEPGFDIWGQCRWRCFDDPLCEGFSITTIWLSVNQSIGFNTCNLATSSNASSYCSFNQPVDPNLPPTSSGPIDPNATCKEQMEVPGDDTIINYHSGCFIKKD